MTPILKAGLAIGALCGVWMFVMGLTGWYKDPDLSMPLFLGPVIAIEVAGLVWGLRRTAAEGRGYAQQIVAGTFMSIIAGVVVIVCSLVFTMMAFPEYFRELEVMQRQALLEQGKSPSEIDREVADVTGTATPMANAMSGFIGTLITGILASAVIAMFARRRSGGRGLVR